MIYATELRIGNIISYRGDVDCIVESISLSKGILTERLDTDNKGTGLPYGSTDIGEYEPIPLTDEWLNKVGFDKDGFLISNKMGDVYLKRPFVGAPHLQVKTVAGSKLTSVKYVHQLQNLYFCLTGEELIK